MRKKLKLIRSSKCSLKFSTDRKRIELSRVLLEYGRVCNFFINHFWTTETPAKKDLLKGIVNLPESWITARLKKVAAREAIDMITAVKKRWKDKPEKISMPTHAGKRMYVSCTIAALQDPKDSSFDAWLHLQSIGDDVILDLPIKFHKHYNKLASKGQRLNSYIITPKEVQFSFEIDPGEPLKGNKAVGIDTGINALASANTGKQFGLDTKALVERIKRCEHGSNGQKTARRALKQRMDEVVKEILNHFKDVDCVVVEALKNLNYKTKLKRRLSRNIRRSIGTWAYRYWLRRMQMTCEMNRVHYHEVPPQYTSQRCPRCGYIDRGNRNGTVFKCLSCGHAGNADVVGSLNILWRFLTGPYGARYQPWDVGSLIHV